MLSKSGFLKTTILTALIGLAGAAAVTPAIAHDYYGNGGYHRDRDDRGWGDRRDHRGWDRHDRDDRGWGWRHHRHHGWY